MTHTKHELDLTALCFRSRLTGESGKHRIVVRHGKFLGRRSLDLEVRPRQDDRGFLTQTLQERSVILNGQADVVCIEFRDFVLLVVCSRD